MSLGELDDVCVTVEETPTLPSLNSSGCMTFTGPASSCIDDRIDQYIGGHVSGTREYVFPVELLNSGFPLFSGDSRDNILYTSAVFEMTSVSLHP